jgi:hypothetical protein
VEVEMAVMPWVLPAGQGMEQTIPVPVFDPSKQATLWMVKGWEPADFQGLYFVRDQGAGKTPQQEEWGGTGPFTLVQDDRPSWSLPAGTTSVAAMYDSDHDIAVMVVYPAV